MGSTSILVLLTLLGLSSAASPSFCRGKVCPPFTVMGSTEEYVIRKYGPTVWLEIELAPGENHRTSFQKLRSYFTENGLTWNLPIVSHLSLTDTTHRVMRAYLGECKPEFRPTPPTDPRLHIHHDPELSYYVTPLKPVPGNANAWRDMNVWKSQARTLIGKLPSQGHVDFCAAHYGPKRTSGNTYSEIWVHTTGNHAQHHAHNHGSSSHAHSGH